MKQKRIQTVPQAIAASATAYGAATATGEAVGLKTSTGPVIKAEHDALVAANNAHKAGKLAYDVQLGAYRGFITMVTLFIMTLRDVLRTHIGTRHSVKWDAVGFIGSLAIPRTLVGLRYVLEQAKAYFAANPAHQNNELNINVANIEMMLADLDAALAALKAAKTSVGNLKRVRDEKFKAVIKRMAALLSELKVLREPMDLIFEQYGFKLPGALATPDVPGNVTTIIVGSNAVAVKWAAAARAQYYRVWKQVEGVDAEFVAVGSPADVDFTIEGLPPKAKLTIAISAVNNGGESVLSEVVAVQLT